MAFSTARLSYGTSFTITICWSPVWNKWSPGVNTFLTEIRGYAIISCYRPPGGGIIMLVHHSIHIRVSYDDVLPDNDTTEVTIHAKIPVWNAEFHQWFRNYVTDFYALLRTMKAEGNQKHQGSSSFMILQNWRTWAVLPEWSRHSSSHAPHSKRKISLHNTHTLLQDQLGGVYNRDRKFSKTPALLGQKIFPHIVDAAIKTPHPLQLHPELQRYFRRLCSIFHRWYGSSLLWWP